MSYCTLEEAWGTNFEKKKKKKQQKKKKDEEIEPFENASNDTTEPEIIKKSENKSESYLYEFNRSPYTLPQHNGSDDRIDIKDNYIIDNSNLDENDDEPNQLRKL